MERAGGKKVDAHYPFRAIKFNLPWFSYRSGENLSLHMETCRDIKYWEAFLEMMVENKFNTLTLWNMHPYMFMVKSEKFPKASPFTDEEMAEWQQFWKQLFKMAKDRGIDTYIVNWNIFVSEEFSKEYNTATYSGSANFLGEGETNPIVEEYTREMVTKTINEYEDLTGIGLTLGERMGGMTSEERRDWVDRTIIAGMKAADRKTRLIYRAPLSAGKKNHGTVSVATEQLTRDAVENLGMDENVWIEFKFNWSHAHSSPKVSIVHGGMLTDTYWEPVSDKYKGVWTMRNEDFFVMRWAQPDFIRDFIGYNSQEYIGGCLIGSETYIPAKDYFTKEEFRKWDYAFERQWLFYKVWGNLLYDSATPDSYFASALASKFGLEDGTQLLEAWKLSSMNANRFASFFRGTWDATIYTEGFTTINGKFIDINKFIGHPVLDSSYVNIADFVRGKYNEEKQIDPWQLANLTEEESKKALAIIEELRKNGVSEELEIELTDIEFWANYGLYFAAKINAGAALEEWRIGEEEYGQKAAVEYLEGALENWKKMVELAEKYNVGVIPYQFDQEFSWRKHIPDVEHDIKIAKENIVSDEKIDLR
ncbi:hypothetical protein R9C00_06220 [Flammeovirgaceae bacterium SG7u.111]|nr:hypothetical protein [Flammeovirgaceae bacterium SG7u.132]WPO37037.1 hypothetical protein R9C00_06220 [Flammeovirgaceae bacterium SG7u.111]